MQRTVFDTPVVTAPLRWLSLFMLWVLGWKFEGGLPDVPQYVVVIEPHTSNWDFPIGMFFGFKLRVKASWLGKHTMFRPPFNGFFRWLGGIPVERSHAHNIVAQAVQLFEHRPQLVLGITPEGARKRVANWKTGFYHIARGANVPIALAYLDYARKTGGFGPLIQPSGDLQADFRIIRDFYAGVAARHPDRVTLPVIEEEEKRG